MKESSDKPRDTKPTTDYRIPLPLATAGIGLLLAWVSPGGLSGGTGFLIGLIIGVLLNAVRASQVGRRKSHFSHEVECPNCLVILRLTIEPEITVAHRDPESTHGGLNVR